LSRHAQPRARRGPPSRHRARARFWGRD
jgi:hypothetical protein